MKNLASILSVFSIVVLITACEKSPEARFDVSSIPGQYEGHTDVYEPYDTIDGRIRWGTAITIPESYREHHEKYIIEIQKVKKNHYTFTFEPIDTILPNEITVEITGFHEYSWDEIQADIRVLENDLFKDTVFYGNVYGYWNQFRYSESEVFPRISYNILLKSKTLDNILLGCTGSRYYD